MPLIEEHRRRVIGYDHRVRLDHCTVEIYVKAPDGAAPLEGSLGLPDAFRSVKVNRGEVRNQLVQFVIQNPPHIASTELSSTGH